MAAKRLSADTLSLSSTGSSMVKGETLIDTAKNLQAMSPDLIVIRHSSTGAPHLLARQVKAGIINAGDGTNEHPTQGLLDLYTIREKKGRISGLKVAIIGDIEHSRVARSDIIGLLKMGAEVTISGPPTMIPLRADSLGVKVEYNPAEAIKDKDVIIMHPGPINRGVELSSDVADGPFSVILDQVANGVAVRMALLYLLMGGVKSEDVN
jgi:aspartate carbamoyltransferase catalytic subunit